MIPQGADDICVDNLSSLTYYTPAATGSAYEWFVTNGTILTDNTLNSIEVEWNGIGMGEIWYREYNPGVSNCEGVSDKLKVRIREGVQVTPIVSNIPCNGENNGEISLNLSGGKGQYEVTWNNGMQGESLTGLAPGTYIATIKDAGCVIERTFEIEQPDELNVQDIEISHSLCHQEAGGSVVVSVNGGSGPYTYRLVNENGEDQVHSSNVLSNLLAGRYVMSISDANGCVVTSEFLVNEPNPIELDFDRLINLSTCPQTSEGEIVAEAKGGVPDYTFTWEAPTMTNGKRLSGLSRGVYSVRITDSNGCEVVKDISVSERFPRAYIPNTFSPNGDGENDKFQVVSDCPANYQMQIFNKWGNLVFSTTDASDGWDGTSNGKKVPDGAYAYKVFFVGTINGVVVEEKIHGTVRIFR